MVEAGKVEVDVSREHPLQYGWTLFYSGQQDNKKKSVGVYNWDQQLKKITTVKSVEDFWGAFNSVPEPSLLLTHAAYYLFKDGIEPKWEDPANANGGRFVLTMRKSRSGHNERKLNDRWLNTVLFAIGDGFAPDLSEQISGLVLQIKASNNRIALWTKTADPDTLDGIETQWRESVCDSPSDDWDIEFNAFQSQETDKKKHEKQPHADRAFRVARAEERI